MFVHFDSDRSPIHTQTISKNEEGNRSLSPLPYIENRSREPRGRNGGKLMAAGVGGVEKAPSGDGGQYDDDDKENTCQEMYVCVVYVSANVRPRRGNSPCQWV